MTFPDDYGNFEEKDIAIAYHLAKQEEVNYRRNVYNCVFTNAANGFLNIFRVNLLSRSGSCLNILNGVSSINILHRLLHSVVPQAMGGKLKSSFPVLTPITKTNVILTDQMK